MPFTTAPNRLPMLRPRRSLHPATGTFSQLRGSRMKTWKKPVVREVNCGAEINCYVSGEF
ncbi:pyrroloquinoline quinone precursor peptide PqqA [Xanthomonas prunicola]|uniref:pyrroloquinoline quinone precursor peptide PqqA n=1 Tax=Xanthomonas prunicola TaxID=2053930 RepID=UPI003134513C